MNDKNYSYIVVNDYNHSIQLQLNRIVLLLCTTYLKSDLKRIQFFQLLSMALVTFPVSAYVMRDTVGTPVKRTLMCAAISSPVLPTLYAPILDQTSTCAPVQLAPQGRTVRQT